MKFLKTLYKCQLINTKQKSNNNNNYDCIYILMDLYFYNNIKKCQELNSFNIINIFTLFINKQ